MIILKLIGFIYDRGFGISCLKPSDKLPVGIAPVGHERKLFTVKILEGESFFLCQRVVFVDYCHYGDSGKKRCADPVVPDGAAHDSQVTFPTKELLADKAIRALIK